MIECCILEVKVSVFKKKIRISLNLCNSRITHFIDKKFYVYTSLLFLALFHRYILVIYGFMQKLNLLSKIQIVETSSEKTIIHFMSTLGHRTSYDVLDIKNLKYAIHNVDDSIAG